MREIPKWLTRMISRLMPTQKSSGSGAVQIGKLDGDVTTVHLTQHIYAPHMPSHRAAQPPVRVSRPERRAEPRPSPKTDQSQVLALMEHLPDRIAVLDFMDREFGTRMVVALEPKQLYRLRRYVEVILAAKGGK